MPRLRVEEASDDDCNTSSQSQRDTEISSETQTKLAGLVCNYLLVAECKKIPAKRADIKKLIPKENARHLPKIMAEVNNIMEQVYAYKVVELEKSNYILINNIGTNHSDHDNTSKISDTAKTGLLTAILAGIFMTGELMQEKHFIQYLKKLDVDILSKNPHPELGNVAKLIHQEFTKQKYLEITSDTTTDPPTREYRWGERAHLELSKRDILELVCKVYGNHMRPERWMSQWKIVQKEKGAPENTEPQPRRLRIEK
ncbi:non-structural maintenance of chromosomes element 3 homolog [Homarus americanus]|uniref:non-structural maintenance of chromosomes element 3 homolog n=1 Tax=Homarus americanus TaxID=6706 RepID=UPI001C48E25F|nr:non-structural maintenance of chromosomes element 3 homolog [Homarus americanus]